MKSANVYPLKTRDRNAHFRLWSTLGALIVLFTACSTAYPETCPSSIPIGLREADEIAGDESLPFRFPLEGFTEDDTIFYGWFGVSNQCPPDMTDCYEYPTRNFHAAEDYKRPAGTPVYAMADGRISYSGTAGGYGWLIIIDHPQVNLYSLYGHLSPSRWKLEKGTEVKRGDLIAYLGDDDENGGSEESPVVPHLHFGIRAGQAADYPNRGEWRFQAGWIRLCPQDLGWLQPSQVISNQEIPAGGYPVPEVGFLTRWGLELLLFSVYVGGGSMTLIYAIKKKSRLLMIFPGLVVIAAGIVLWNYRLLSTPATLLAGILILVVGGYYYFRRTGAE